MHAMKVENKIAPSKFGRERVGIRRLALNKSAPWWWAGVWRATRRHRVDQHYTAKTICENSNYLGYSARLFRPFVSRKGRKRVKNEDLQCTDARRGSSV